MSSRIDPAVAGAEEDDHRRDHGPGDLEPGVAVDRLAVGLVAGLRPVASRPRSRTSPSRSRRRSTRARSSRRRGGRSARPPPTPRRPNQSNWSMNTDITIESTTIAATSFEIGRSGHRRGFYIPPPPGPGDGSSAVGALAPAGTRGRSSSRPSEAAITPRATPSQLHRRATVCAQGGPRGLPLALGRARASALSRSAIASTAPSPELEGDELAQPRRSSGGGQLAADLGDAGVGGADRAAPPRPRPRRRPSRTPPGRCSGRRAPRSPGTSSPHLVVLEPPGEADRSRSPPSAALDVALRRDGHRGRRASISQRALAPRPRAPPPAGDLARDRRDRRRRAPSTAARAPRGTRRSRRRAGGRPGSRPTTSGHAASSRSTPLETISLPTNTTRGPSPSANHSTASAAVRGSRPQALRGLGASRRGRWPGRGSPCVAASAARRAGAKSSVSTPGGPEARLLLQSPGISSASHRLSAVWREPTRTPERGLHPLAGERAEALDARA